MLDLAAHFESKFFGAFKFVGATDSAAPVGIMLHLAQVLTPLFKSCVCVCVCERERERERECVCVCVRVRVNVCIYVYKYIRIYIHTYVYAYIHTSTHIHPPTHTQTQVLTPLLNNATLPCLRMIFFDGEEVCSEKSWILALHI